MERRLGVHSLMGAIGCLEISRNFLQYINQEGIKMLLIIIFSVLLCAVGGIVGPVEAAGNILTWQDNSDNETTFNIERKVEICTGTLPFTPLASVSANIVTYTDNTVIEGSTYC